MKNSMYDIDGDKYELDNNRLKNIIMSQNPNRGALELFYRKMMDEIPGLSKDTIKKWVNNDTNPALDDVKKMAEVLDVDYLQLLNRTHLSVENARSLINRVQKIRFSGVLDPFCFRYEGFSNVLDMIIGNGYNPSEKTTRISDFSERIICIIGRDKLEDCSLPELLGYKFKYSDEQLQKMTADVFLKALKNGYIDDEGNPFFDENGKISIDRKKFGERLIANTTWLNNEDREELQNVINEAESWWEYCEIPYAQFQVNINVCGRPIASFTYGPGWVSPTHEDRWALLLDVLALLGTQLDTTGLCWIHEMHVDQNEYEMFLTIEAVKFYE